jgi:hypothetical protein
MGKASRRKLADRALLATNLPTSQPTGDQTIAPGMALSPTAYSWIGDEATTNEVSVADRRAYAQSGAELVDRVLHHGVNLHRRTAFLVLILTWIVFVGWLFSQDNGAGKLDTWHGISWFFGKVGAMTLFAGVGAGLIRLVTED